MRYRVSAIVLACSSLATAQPEQPEPSPPSAEEVVDLTGDPESHYQSPSPTQEGEPETPASAPAPTAPAPTGTAAPATTAPPAQPTPAAADPAVLNETPAGAHSAAADSACDDNWVRSGFYLRAVSGMAYLSATGNGPVGDATLSGFGSGSTTAIGGALTRGLVLALAIETSQTTSDFGGGPFETATVVTDDDSDEASAKASVTHLGLEALVDWYPNPAAGWHVGLGGGLGLLTVENHADDSVLVGAGVAGNILGGYDWLIARKWSVGLALRASVSPSIKLMDEDGEDTGYKLAPWSVGLGGSILYH